MHAITEHFKFENEECEQVFSTQQGGYRAAWCREAHFSRSLMPSVIANLNKRHRLPCQSVKMCCVVNYVCVALLCVVK